MEIADAVSCDFYHSDDWKGREESEFQIYKQDKQVGLDIETTWVGSDENTETITRLNLTRVDIDTVRRIQSRLGDWLQQGRNGEKKLTTRPIEGTYVDRSMKAEVHHLQIDIVREGIQILAISSEKQPVENAVRIPSTHTVHDDNIESCNHLERLYSLLEIFLAGIDQENEDIMQSTRYLMNPETHLHSQLPSECLDRFDNSDHTGVVQAAGTALEEMLESKVPDEIVREARNTSDIANRAFKENEPVFKWGYTGGEQKGLMFLYSGAFMALRNPTSHPRGDPDRNRFLDDINERDALDILCLFNFLVRRLDTYGTTELEQKES